MPKTSWKPGTMVYPVPAVMVTCGNKPENYNIITIAWTGTINCLLRHIVYKSSTLHFTLNWSLTLLIFS